MDYGIHGHYKQNVAANINTKSQIADDYTKEKHKNKNDSDVFMGSIVNNGNATIVISMVGDKTYYGNIASLVQEKTIDSPLKHRLRLLASTISKFGYIAAFIILFSYR